MKRLILAVLSVCVLSACNTFAGLGQDLKQAGGAIERKAKE